MSCVIRSIQFIRGKSVQYLWHRAPQWQHRDKSHVSTSHSEHVYYAKHTHTHKRIHSATEDGQGYAALLPHFHFHTLYLFSIISAIHIAKINDYFRASFSSMWMFVCTIRIRICVCIANDLIMHWDFHQPELIALCTNNQTLLCRQPYVLDDGGIINQASILAYLSTILWRKRSQCIMVEEAEGICPAYAHSSLMGMVIFCCCCCCSRN